MEKENKISYEEYLKLMQQEMTSKTGQRVELQKIRKNNGIVLDGLVILSKETNVSPTIYLNRYYQEFLEKGKQIVVDKILALYEESKTEIFFHVDMLRDFNKVKDKIKMKLINYEKNKELLETIPYRKVLDLAIVFMIVLETEDACEFGTIQVHNGFLNYWKIQEDSLYQIAKENMANDFQTIPLENIVNAVLENGLEKEIVDELDFPLYILTTHSRLHGAIGMLQTELLNAFMQKHQTEKLIILPSSIHEVLLVPYEIAEEDLDFYTIVHDVNETQLATQEILSNTVYVYDGEKLDIF